MGEANVKMTRNVYRCSYGGWCALQDSNLRPPGS